MKEMYTDSADMHTFFYWKHFIRDPQQKTLETPTMLQRKENLLLF